MVCGVCVCSVCVCSVCIVCVVLCCVCVCACVVCGGLAVRALAGSSPIVTTGEKRIFSTWAPFPGPSKIVNWEPGLSWGLALPQSSLKLRTGPQPWAGECNQ